MSAVTWSSCDVESRFGKFRQLLDKVEAGDTEAAEKLLPTVYAELRRLAAHKLARETPGQTLQPTALVHEAYLRLIGTEDPGWDGRGHFFGAAAEAMRRILVESARRKARPKHGGDLQRVDLDAEDAVLDERSSHLLALDEALGRLALADPAKAELVKLWYFAGMTLSQAADALGISRTTADRYWAYARAWLYHELNSGDPRNEKS